MVARIRQRVRRFLAAPRGTRFRAYHERLRRHASVWRTLLFAGIGLIVLALGLAMLVLPGPGLLFAAIGAALIAGESRVAADVLDRLDLWLARLWTRLRKRA
jgi:hypothetical protein